MRIKRLTYHAIAAAAIQGCAHILRPRVFTLLIVGLLITGCADSPSILAPKGPAAAEIANLGWIMIGLGAAVYVIVIGLFLFTAFRPREAGTNPEYPPVNSAPDEGRTIVVLGGVVFPTIILLIVLGLTVETMLQLATPDVTDDVTIQVVGNRWWWEVNYPNQSVTTANEIHIPVGQPIEVKLTSEDVIHSFWVPELHGKLDLIPGKVNSFWLEAEEPGVYWGQCAEFCGIQHAKMALLVIAQPPDEFAAWLEQQQQPAAAPTSDQTQRGLQVFLESDCANCHTIQGTDATGNLGPDLTHLDSRRTLAAGTLENTRGALSGWIVDSQSIKPGNLMPPFGDIAATPSQRFRDADTLRRGNRLADFLRRRKTVVR